MKLLSFTSFDVIVMLIYIEKNAISSTFMTYIFLCTKSNQSQTYHKQEETYR